MKDVHAAARDAYLLWKQSGKPRQGVIYDLMKQTRSKFKYALRVCKGNKNSIISDKIAEAMCSKNDRAFWREIKNSSNSKIKLPNVVGNAQGSDNISGMWQEHYSHIFNMVHESNCKDLHSDLCSNHSLFDQDMVVTSNEMEDIIKDLSYDKSPGLDGISSEHMKFAGQQLPVLLSKLMSAILVHGYVPKSMLKSVIIPIIKNKNKRISDKDNYRPICLANVFTKVVEKVLYSRMEGYLQSTSNQFGFKRKHGTEMCVFVLKELIRYYVKHGSCMYVAFLDASKAFDRVNHTKLFSKLLRLGVPTWVIKVLVQWYCNQSMCVRWGSVFSDFFLVNNGVRQGGIISPLLFNVYINELSESLSKLPIGCCCGNTVVNHIMYADDIVLFAPSAKGLQKTVNVCYAYGCDNDIIFNSSKSQVMFFDTLKCGHMKDIMLGQNTLHVTKSYTYLGHIITDNLCDEADIKAKVGCLYGRSNMLLRKFYFCSERVKNRLFSSYCSNLYLCSLWANYRKSSISRFIVSYNNSSSLGRFTRPQFRKVKR